MSRLIDADDLIEYIKIWDIGNSISSDQKEFIDCVNRQFTAFNVDKVVEQLKDLKVRYFLTIANTGDADKDCAYKNIANTIDKAIEIVKGSGVDD
ncbi:hypothetical protein DMI82_12485 [Blautia sp. BCRC 81119]|jgi:hypothetical protein|uniref:hypothetical protein n=1 Tax=Blautia sp. BCRC 81119 TaxID=2212480 RepID=UPI000D73BCE2|nr:hypothetical protein [Blautia sp. BCRC 81119]PWY59031.1 hypothetical protein DMI82_12485 [Blautia sp. BCRC 81119]